MENNRRKETVLCLFPNRNGVAYAIFDSPEELIDVGIGYVQPVSNKRTMQLIRGYIAYYKPTVIITRNINDMKKRKNRRIQRLIDLICMEARYQQLEVYSYTRTQIRETFQQFGVRSKHQISKKIIEWFSKLHIYETPPRKKWMAENPNMGIFDAISLAVVHWYLGNGEAS